MNFQRGLDPKEAMDLGDHHIAPIIDTLYSLNPTNMMAHSDGSYGPERIALSPSRTEELLTLIQRGDAPKKMRFYAFLSSDREFIRLHKYLDRYVCYKDKKYKILDPSK